MFGRLRWCGGLGLLAPVVCLGLGRRDVADGLKQAMVVEPRHPLQRRQLDRLARLPRPAPVDDLGLVQPIDGLGQRVVVAVAGGAYLGLDAGFGQAFAVADADVLAAPVAVVGQAPSRQGWRAYSACSSASSTKSVCIELLTRQPTT